MDLTPEWLKQATGRARYERLIGNIGGLMMQLDVAEALIKRYTPPKQHSWQIPAPEDLAKDLKDARTSVGTFRRRLRKYEADLVSKDWKV